MSNFFNQELLLPPDELQFLLSNSKPGDTFVWLTSLRFSIVLSYSSTLKQFISVQRDIGTAFIASEITITGIHSNAIYAAIVDLPPDDLDTFCYQ
jgi:hypothetical protein